MVFETTQKDLHRVRKAYSILDDVDLRIPSKNNTSSHPLRGYVTLYLECFKFGVRLPLQPYLGRILGVKWVENSLWSISYVQKV